MFAMTGARSFLSLVHRLYFPSFLLHPLSGILQWLSWPCYCCDYCCSLQNCHLLTTSALLCFSSPPLVSPPQPALLIRINYDQEKITRKKPSTEHNAAISQLYECASMCRQVPVCVGQGQGTMLQSQLSPDICEVQGWTHKRFYTLSHLTGPVFIFNKHFLLLWVLLFIIYWSDLGKERHVATHSVAYLYS